MSTPKESNYVRYPTKEPKNNKIIWIVLIKCSMFNFNSYAFLFACPVPHASIRFENEASAIVRKCSELKNHVSQMKVEMPVEPLVIICMILYHPKQSLVFLLLTIYATWQCSLIIFLVLIYFSSNTSEWAAEQTVFVVFGPFVGRF